MNSLQGCSLEARFFSSVVKLSALVPTAAFSPFGAGKSLDLEIEWRVQTLAERGRHVHPFLPGSSSGSGKRSSPNSFPVRVGSGTALRDVCGLQRPWQCCIPRRGISKFVEEQGICSRGLTGIGMEDPWSPSRCKRGAAGVFVEMAGVLVAKGLATLGKRRFTMSLFDAFLSFGTNVEISVSLMT